MYHLCRASMALSPPLYGRDLKDLLGEAGAFRRLALEFWDRRGLQTLPKADCFEMASMHVVLQSQYTQRTNYTLVSNPL